MTTKKAISVRQISPGTSLISRAGRRSALTGRYVTAATAMRHPRTTVVEATGGHSNSRSASTGRYVTKTRPASGDDSENAAVSTDAEITEG